MIDAHGIGGSQDGGTPSGLCIAPSLRRHSRTRHGYLSSLRDQMSRLLYGESAWVRRGSPLLCIKVYEPWRIEVGLIQATGNISVLIYPSSMHATEERKTPLEMLVLIDTGIYRACSRQ